MKSFFLLFTAQQHGSLCCTRGSTEEMTQQNKPVFYVLLRTIKSFVPNMTYRVNRNFCSKFLQVRKNNKPHSNYV